MRSLSAINYNRFKELYLLPWQLEKTSKQNFILYKFSSLAWAKLKRSSANCIWAIRVRSLASLKPFIPLHKVSLSINLAKTIPANTKRKGERGSPCLTPLWDLMNSNGLPFIRMEKDVVETHCITHYIQVSRNSK